MKGLLAVKAYPKLPITPDKRKRVTNARLPTIRSKYVPKKNNANILKNKWDKSLCKKIEVTNIHGYVSEKAGKNAKNPHREGSARY